MASQTATSGVLGTTETVSTASSSPNNKLSASTASSQARGKKRPASPGNSSCPALGSISNSYNNNTSKKKKTIFTAPASQVQAPMPVVDSVAELKTTGPSDTSTGAVELNTAKPLPFKDPNFVHSGIGGAAAGKKNRTWKNLKQILAAERALPWQLNDPCYYNIDAPPSLKPAKKYSDISGLPANYTDPQTKLRFTSSEEFSYIRLLPTDVVSGYLALRKASCVVP